jgi:diaminohydroxyphosphoribosylaminopyrimidine deaminase / 5-amino-6-(5-phosphoribosylamino)uracil reductase
MPKSDLITDQDRTHLRRALDLAELGRGRVSPNPVVGAVLVRDGEVIGEGHHAELGGVHAEVAAIEDCRSRDADPAGATMYVTLEPCAHHGRRPPCSEALIAAGVARVVIASDDPSEKASGRGPGALRDEGIEVEFADGSEAAAARLLNQAFRKHSRSGRPLVVFKSAISLDGRVATADGESRWISGAESRALVHRWRAESDAVAVGIGTALADDPLLTARDTDPPPARQPARIVFDSYAKLPLDSALVRSIDEAPLMVVTGPGADADRSAALEAAGAEVVAVGGEGPARVETALDELGRREITSVLLEGGPTLAGSFFDAGEVDRLALFVAPIVLGGRGSRSVVEGRGAAAVADAPRALDTGVERIGDDVLIEARLREW